MRHPSDYYVRYMLASSWADPEHPLTIESVNTTLKECGLLEIRQDQWDGLRDTFQAPPDFLFNNIRHPTSVEFMRAEKLYTLWAPNEATQRVLNEIIGTHGDRSYQHDMHILLMGDVPHKIIAQKLSKKYRLASSLTPEMIEIYEHYFWRRKNLNQVEWVEFLRGHPHSDSYLASLFCGEHQALFRAGLKPKYDVKRALRTTHRQISFRLDYLEYHPDGEATNDEVVKLSREQRALYNVLYGEGGGYEEQLREARHWIMKYKDAAIQGIADLVGSDGSYSGDGKEEQAKKTSEEDEEDEGEE